MKQVFILLFFALITFSCTKPVPQFGFSEKGREVPVFDADSAFFWIEKQVELGPRNPNTWGHVQVQELLIREFERYAGKGFVFAQRFEYPGYGNDTLKLANIIASFNPGASDRIVLSAHYDTRPRADMDDARSSEAILGADDGGSGVGVLLEMARIFSTDTPPLGVDIILFDGEDYGTSSDLSRYFLGSRQWSEKPPVPGYRPRFGILLDMVGAGGAVFPKESNSYSYAPGLVDELWNIAKERGYQELFVDEPGAGVLDDHVIVQRTTGIPFIDIINHQRGAGGTVVFPSHWHTHKDNMEVISRQTLQAVGDVLTELIFNRIE